MREGETNRDKSHHDHLYFGPLCTVFLDDIIEKYNLCQLHGHVVLCPTDTINTLVHFELCLNTCSFTSRNWSVENYGVISHVPAWVSETTEGLTQRGGTRILVRMRLSGRPLSEDIPTRGMSCEPHSNTVIEYTVPYGTIFTSSGIFLKRFNTLSGFKFSCNQITQSLDPA